MIDDKTRLLILVEHYRAFRDGKVVPSPGNNHNLDLIDKTKYTIEYGILVELGYIEADLRHSDTGHKVYTPMSGITAPGSILMEQFLRDCIKDCKGIDYEIHSYLNALLKLIEMWDKDEKLFQTHIMLMASLIRTTN